MRGAEGIAILEHMKAFAQRVVVSGFLVAAVLAFVVFSLFEMSRAALIAHAAEKKQCKEDAGPSAGAPEQVQFVSCAGFLE